MKINDFYKRNDLRLCEIPAGSKCPVRKGWPSLNKKAEAVEPLLDGKFYNKFGWLLDDDHLVVDIDVHNATENGYESLARLEAEIGLKLEDACGAVVQSPSGGRHYYFSKSPGLTIGKTFKDIYPGIDFISGKGKQVVAAGSCHDSHPGKAYSINENAELLEVPTKLIEHLQSLKPAQNHRPKPAAFATVGERSGDEFNKTERGLSLLIGELSGRGYEVRQAHNFWKFNRPGKTTQSDCSGHVGKQSKNGNYQLTCFSLSDSYFPSGESMTIFRAYSLLCYGGDDRRAASALYERGFAEQPGERGGLLTNPLPKNDLGVDLSGLLSKTPAKPQKQSAKASKFPKECLRPPGLISEIIDYNLATSLYPQPELALAGAIALMATITGGKITDRYSTRTNVYVLGLAPSGSGKEQARRINKEILYAAGGDKMLGPERIGSSAGMVVAIAEQSPILFQLDEIGRLVQTLKNPSKSPHLYNIATVLMSLFSASDTVWVGDAYADIKKVRTIDQPHAVVYGTSVADSFWGSLTAENVNDGLLGRMMPFESSDGYVDPQQTNEIDLPQSIIDKVREWIRFDPGGDLAKIHPQPTMVRHTTEAKRRFDDHMLAIAKRRKGDDEQVASIWSRSAGRAGKLALIFAASRQGVSDSLCIELEDVDRGIAIGNYLTRRMLSEIEERVSDNEQESKTKRVLRLLEKPMTKSQLTRRTQWLRARERDEIVSTLIDAGLISTRELETSGRTKLEFYRTDPLE